jgi:acetylornithine aminotransferase
LLPSLALRKKDADQLLEAIKEEVQIGAESIAK